MASAFDTDVDFSESRARDINVIGWVFTGIAMAAVFLKIINRVGSKRFGWDDFFIFFSLVRQSELWEAIDLKSNCHFNVCRLLALSRLHLSLTPSHWVWADIQRQSWRSMDLQDMKK